MPFALGENYGVVGIMFHGAQIQLGLCTVVVTCVKKKVIKLPCSNEVGS
jgi:hypothetical protein